MRYTRIAACAGIPHYMGMFGACMLTHARAKSSKQTDRLICCRNATASYYNASKEMPIKINELVIQVKVHDEPKQMDSFSYTLTAQQHLLAKNLLDLELDLQIQEAR